MIQPISFSYIDLSAFLISRCLKLQKWKRYVEEQLSWHTLAFSNSHMVLVLLQNQIAWNIHIHLLEVPTPQSSSGIRATLSYQSYCQRKEGEWLFFGTFAVTNIPGVVQGSLGQLCSLRNLEYMKSGIEGWLMTLFLYSQFLHACLSWGHLFLF